MAFNILYATNPDIDIVSLLTYIDEFTKSLGEENVQIDVEKCMSVLQVIRNDFPHKDGLEQANVFKKIANFVCYFIAERPIVSTFCVESVGESLSKINNHQNAMVALQIAIDSLHGGVVKADSKDRQILKNRIQLSQHSYIDIIDAIRNISHVNHFRLLTVFLEQLAYKSNPDCQYKLLDI